MNLRLLWLVLLTAVMLNRPCFSQDRLSAPSYTPANLWMTYPVPWSPLTDTVPPDIRRQRDEYFDKLIGLPTPLTPENASGSGLSEGARLAGQPEIYDVPDRTIMIATFSQYQPVLSKSERSIYTEAALSVTDVFEDAGGNAPGSGIVLILPGGSVKTDAGTSLSFLTQPRQFFISVGRTYLFVLSYHAEGNFYMLAQDWDLTDGIVRRNFAAPKGVPATLDGLTVGELAKRLRALK